MLNKEKYKNEIWEHISKYGNFPAITKEGCKDCRVTNCTDDGCFFYRADTICEEGLIEWLNSEYVEPEIDWSKVPIDAPVLVSNGDGEWYKRYFVRYENGKVNTWSCGTTSWSADDMSDVVNWEYAKLANEADIEKYKKE